MRQVKEKYRKLAPTIEYLSDEVIMAQAWKKTHSYIRAFNWYADTLALDMSALTIESDAPYWADKIEGNTRLRKLELIPAAKSDEWELGENGWQPIKKSEEKTNEKVPLRPLAHLTIRDQTWASAAMLCLADAVETAQGNCGNEISFEQARKNKVYSYGNRLVCEWNTKHQAWFRWGNSEVYRKFFTDYQSFLKRPVKLGRIAQQNLGNSRDVFVVNLDLSSFYSTIDINDLIERLKQISDDYGHEYCESFWKTLKKITNWKWDEESLTLARKLKWDGVLKGLPQGLVSAGFYANAYLVNFDREIGSLLSNESSDDAEFLLHDYCRYVDDLRVVISSSEKSTEEVKKFINNLFNSKLKEHGGTTLSINPGKTKITHISDLDNPGSLSSRVEVIQSELSGPADREILDSATGVLESLLTMDYEAVGSLGKEHSDFSLQELTQFEQDIRPDTLKRFAANRLESIVKGKRLIQMPALDHNQATGSNERNNELLAKKLISAWIKDPSLVLVLRKAIEIYPDRELFEPVFDAIFERCSIGSNTNLVTNTFMNYVLADLFRCGIDFHGYQQYIDYPESLNPLSIIELMSVYAQQVVAHEDKTLRCLQRQALMLLAVANKPVLTMKSTQNIQSTLHAILVSNPPKYQKQRAVLYEIAGQLTNDFDNYASLYIKTLPDDVDDKYVAIEAFAKRGGPFWESVWMQIYKRDELLTLRNRLNWAVSNGPSKLSSKDIVLSRVIESEVNPFEYEHSLIKLALALIELVQSEDCIGLSPKQIKVSLEKVSSWNRLWMPDIKVVSCSRVNLYDIEDPRFDIPTWIIKDENKDYSKLYWIGSILRAAVLGSDDFTSRNWDKSKCVSYKGVKASWYKRRMAMMHSPESVVGEYATVSNWFSDLLTKCLQWPGFESTNIKSQDILKVESLGSLQECLKDRLKYLNSQYCSASELPVLPTQIKSLSNKDYFRIVTVQQLLPKKGDFNFSDPELNNALYRTKHREHVLDICQLIIKTLDTKLKTEKEEKPFADLIVFPEISVHIKDQDVLKKLADKTKSIVFAGMVFTDRNGSLVNFARWFIPNYQPSGRQWIYRDQGKENLTKDEKLAGIKSYRPCQHIIEVYGHKEGPFKLSGAVCYDATDIKLAADLKGKTDLFVIAAHNRDVSTFDNMVSALHYHMYQHVVVCNIGEFGGSTIQAPYKQPYDKVISHVHGVGQISINMADVDLAAFRRSTKKYKEVKTKPAGL